jgi:hypothetical protein
MEERMARRWWKWLVIGVIVMPLLVWGYDRVQMIMWVGSTDLEVEFAISDAVTGLPIRGARTEIQQDEGGFYEDKDQKKFVLVSNDDGLASKECRNSMCVGTRSGLGFTDTFVVHLPYWRFRVVAENYKPGQWTDLDVPQYIRQVRPAGTRKARLVVLVSLEKGHAEPVAADRPGPHCGCSEFKGFSAAPRGV